MSIIRKVWTLYVVSSHHWVDDNRTNYKYFRPQCHLRLTSPAHAQSLYAHFSTKHNAQTNALASVCEVLPADSVVKPISIEIISGRKEEMYWEKVPEKVRRAALEKMKTVGPDGDNDEKDEEETKKGKKRKRRR